MSQLSLFYGLVKSVVRVTARRLSGQQLRPEWSFGFETFADVLKQSELRIRELPTSAQGEAWERQKMPHPVLKLVRFESVSAGGVDAEWVIPHNDSNLSPIVLYFHGGWYCTASPRNYRELLARIATTAHVRMLAVDYRLAPEHPFPAAVEDALKSWHWLMSTGIEPKHVALAGDSAGGGLAAALLVSLRDAGEALPASATLLCPWVDLSASGGSMIQNERFDWSDPDAVAERVRLYLGDRDPKTPLASPIFADLRGLPPMLIQTGGAEMLLDQDIRFAEVARDAGVTVTLDMVPNMIHDWQLLAAFFPQARASIETIAAFIHANFDYKTAIAGGE